MLKWCAYCQHFLAEKEPYEALEMTHGICSSCRALGHHQNRAYVKSLQPIIDFNNSIKARAEAGQQIQMAEVITEAEQLGLKLLDTAYFSQRLSASCSRQLNCRSNGLIVRRNQCTRLIGL